MAGKLKVWNASTSSWDYITSESTVSKSSAALINTGTDDTKYVTAKAINDSFLGSQGGWTVLTGAAYNDANSLIFAPGTLGAQLNKNSRIKLTDASTVKQFIVQQIATDGGSNQIVFLVGIGGATLSGGAITLTYCSYFTNPCGFPKIDDYKCSVYRTGNQIISDGTPTKIQLNTKHYDPNNNFDSTTNFRYTAPISGYYQVNASVDVNGVGTVYTYSQIWINGAEFKDGCLGSGNNNQFQSTLSDLIYVPYGQTIELYVFADVTSGSPTVLAGQIATWMSIGFHSI